MNCWSFKHLVMQRSMECLILGFKWILAMFFVILLGCRDTLLKFLSQEYCELCCAWLRYSGSGIDIVLASVTSALLVLCVSHERTQEQKKNHSAALYKIPTLLSIQPGWQLLLTALPPKIKIITACNGGLWRQHAAFLLICLPLWFISEHPSPLIKESL